MRRRLLLGESGPNYVFSAATTSKTVNAKSGSTSISITSTKNGTNTPYVIYSYSGCVTSVTTAATSVTIRYNENTTSSSRSGSVVLKQAESEKMITISVTQNAHSYVFSANTTSVNVTSGASSFTVVIKSTVDNTNIGFGVTSYDGPVTAVTVTTGSTGYAYIYYGESTSSLQNVGTVVLTQNGSNKTITITVTQDAISLYLNHSAVILNATNGSTGYTTFNVTDSGTVTSKPSWANVTYSNGNISVSATSANSATTARTGTTTITIGGTQTTLTIIQMPNSYSSIDGHEYVTIGSLKWAIKDVGASSITDYGNYYQYGKGAAQYAATSGQSDYSGTENPLASSADTATQVMGGGWRMPTMNECNTIRNNVTTYYASYNGVSGGALYDQSSKNCLFFSASGRWNANRLIHEGKYNCLLTSTPYGGVYNYIYSCDIGRNPNNNTDVFSITFSRRDDGQTVRGVHA